MQVWSSHSVSASLIGRVCQGSAPRLLKSSTGCCVGHASLRSRTRSSWRAAGIGRIGSESHAFGRARGAADICGFIQDHRPHSQRRTGLTVSGASVHAATSMRVARKRVLSSHMRCRSRQACGPLPPPHGDGRDLGQSQAPGFERRPRIGTRHQRMGGGVQHKAYITISAFEMRPGLSVSPDW